MEDLGNANIGSSNLEDILHAMMELYSCSSDHYEKATAAEGATACLADLKQSVFETVTSMQNSKSEATVVRGRMTELDADLGRGQLHLSLLDAEMSLISAEEEDIDAEIQRLLTKKKELLLVD